MSYFPFMIELNNEKCLIAGGGTVAYRKVCSMLEFGADVTVVSPEFCPELLGLAEQLDAADKCCGAISAGEMYAARQRGDQDDPGKREVLADQSGCLTLIKRRVQPQDIDDAFVVIMATDDEQVNHDMAELCRQKRILVNVVDVKDECDFYFPAIIKDKEVVISVSTGGQSPVLAGTIKRNIAAHLDKSYGDIAERMGEIREQIKSEIDDEGERKKAFQKIVSSLLDDEAKKTVRVGTRGSRLALAQTELVIAALKAEFSDVDFQMVTMSTRGDRDTSRALLEFGGKAVFVEEFEEALLCGDIDIAVHSAKDMPMELMDGLTIAGTLPRACPQDVLIYKSGRTFAENEHFVVGTSSLRRQYQIKEMYPQAECRNLRGNVGTRIQKLIDGEYDAIILAAAGLERLGILKNTMQVMPSDNDGSLKTDAQSQDVRNGLSVLEHTSNEVSRDGLTYRYLSTEKLLPAACQGIIAIETRASGRTYEMVKSINDTAAYAQLICEREVLHRLNAGCHEPIGVYSEISENGEYMKLSLMKADENPCSSRQTSSGHIQGHIHRNTVTGTAADWKELVGKLIE